MVANMTIFYFILTLFILLYINIVQGKAERLLLVLLGSALSWGLAV